MAGNMQPGFETSAADASEGYDVEPFSRALSRHGLELRKGQTRTLQLNLGYVCNQVCRHCHLEAGPARTEVMSLETADQVIAYARRSGFQTIDITGGAPEMNPHLAHLVEHLSLLTPRLMARSNLTAMANQGADYLIDLYMSYHVVVVASLPSANATQTDSQRGKNVFHQSLAMLRKLNASGFGRHGTGLELNLVSNPTGAFLPVSQSQAERKFRADLERKWGVTFNNLFTFANVPMGRFRQWLKDTGNLGTYMQRLSSSFSPCTVDGLMCRTLVSVSWEGFLFDCDFNLATGAYLAGRKHHVSEMEGLPEPGALIPTGEHCYACTSGSGFT